MKSRKTGQITSLAIKQAKVRILGLTLGEGRDRKAAEEMEEKFGSADRSGALVSSVQLALTIWAMAVEPQV